MDQLRALVEAADKDKVDLVNQLEEERRSASVSQAGRLQFLLIRWGGGGTHNKVRSEIALLFNRKVEDLQFRVEEACITKGDLEVSVKKLMYTVMLNLCFLELSNNCCNFD